MFSYYSTDQEVLVQLGNFKDYFLKQLFNVIEYDVSPLLLTVIHCKFCGKRKKFVLD